MDVAGLVERVQTIAAVRADRSADRGVVESALRSLSECRAWLAASEAALTTRLAEVVSFPEKTIADCTRGSLNDRLKARERAETLAAIPGFANALDDAAVTPAHVDAITKATKGVEEGLRDEFCERVANLVDVASVATVRDFTKRLEHEVRAIRRDDGLAKLERQQAAARLRSWTDADGMTCLSGRFDPITGVRLMARLDAEVQALFTDATPATCPSDPVERQHHLQALALVNLVTGERTAAKSGRPEFIVVIDSTQPDGAGGPAVDWGIPVQIPTRILADMTGGGDMHAVVVRNGVVIHAPGELHLGRSTRLANRDQRRALRAVYATCAIPGCDVRYDRCKLHHVIWWRHGGRTDLDNLLPVCTGHHAKIHDAGWQITLGPNRQLTLTLPDGTIHNTGPPNRRAA